jgi:ABC-type multidrug transport system fused ATPase/permease subunit
MFHNKVCLFDLVWLQNATIRENILFGCTYNAQRYNLTIECCALARDFATLMAGDMTEVGEKGVNLSGGQKARISLARAMYSEANVLLLDDVLSAVDAPTAKHLFEQAICGPLGKGRTRILVTHAVHLCVPKASATIHMTGGTAELCDIPAIKKLESSSFVFEDDYPSEEEEQKPEHKIIEAESRAKGHVSLRVYLQYCMAAGGAFFAMVLIFTYGSVQTLMLLNDVWIKYWADAFRRKVQDPTLDIAFYAYMYAFLGASVVFMLFLRVYVVSKGSIQASRTLHRNLTKRILRAPVRFFEKTPVGRIVNRFSRDIKDIDVDVAYFSGEFLANVVRVLFFLAVILIVNPLSLIGLFPVMVIYIFVGRRYLTVARELKRLDSNSRSPIFSHFGESLNGAATIRAYAQEERFVDALHTKVDLNHQAFSLIWIANRWLGVRIDFVGALIALSTNLSVIYTSYVYGGMDAGFAGLSIAYSLGFTDSLLWLVRMHTLMEMEMNAVERVDEYLSIEEEPPAIIPNNRPPATWPAHGKIEVKNLTLRYTPTGPPVLSNVTFSIQPAEKIGIVGRTGYLQLT